MNKLFSFFLDRLAERFAALLAGSTQFTGRRPACGRPGGPAKPTRRPGPQVRGGRKDGNRGDPPSAGHPTDFPDLAAEAVEVVERLTDDPPRLVEPARGRSAGRPPRTARLRGYPASSGKKRRKPLDSTDPSRTKRERARERDLHITNRDREILQALVQKVRLFSQRQIADHWWDGELANARRRLKRLAHRELSHG